MRRGPRSGDERAEARLLAQPQGELLGARLPAAVLGLEVREPCRGEAERRSADPAARKSRVVDRRSDSERRDRRERPEDPRKERQTVGGGETDGGGAARAGGRVERERLRAPRPGEGAAAERTERLAAAEAQHADVAAPADGTRRVARAERLRGVVDERRAAGAQQRLQGCGRLGDA